jgi:hypothetical protein
MGGATLGSIMGGAANCKDGEVKVPLQVHGTTANPQIIPDVSGATASLLKSQLSCAGGGTGGLATGLAGAAAGGNPAAAGAINQLGGLLGGKKKKP